MIRSICASSLRWANRQRRASEGLPKVVQYLPLVSYRDGCKAALGSRHRALWTTPSRLDQSRQPVGAVERKLEMTFTCEPCGTRSSHQFRAKTYETGVVIIQCPNPACRARHLVADRLGWFEDVQATSGDGGSGSGKKGVDIEELMRRKGETVKRGVADVLAQYTGQEEGLLELTADDVKAKKT